MILTEYIWMYVPIKLVLKKTTCCFCMINLRSPELLVNKQRLQGDWIVTECSPIDFSPESFYQLEKGQEFTVFASGVLKENTELLV